MGREWQINKMLTRRKPSIHCPCIETVLPYYAQKFKRNSIQINLCTHGRAAILSIWSNRIRRIIFNQLSMLFQTNSSHSPAAAILSPSHTHKGEGASTTRFTNAVAMPSCSQSSTYIHVWSWLSSSITNKLEENPASHCVYNVHCTRVRRVEYGGMIANAMTLAPAAAWTRLNIQTLEIIISKRILLVLEWANTNYVAGARTHSDDVTFAKGENERKKKKKKRCYVAKCIIFTLTIYLGRFFEAKPN